MAKLDIRKPTDPIKYITFADDYSQCGGVRGNCVYEIAKNNGESDYVYLESSVGEAVTIRMGDIDNFILALQKAKELWYTI
jgi:hypothetical protein